MVNHETPNKGIHPDSQSSHPALGRSLLSGGASVRAGLGNKSGKSLSSRGSIEGVGSTLELDAREQALDVTGDCVGSHDQHAVEEWMYLLVIDPVACPTSAAIVLSVKPRSLAVLAKL